MVLIDAISRLVPGVLHNDDSASTESFEQGLLEYPQYSRPETWNGKSVPPILLSGDHAKVDLWRHEMSLKRTLERRPDLLDSYELTEADRKYLKELDNDEKSC
jgi:tRNA (guanine37-N1)-methyltransferase